MNTYKIGITGGGGAGYHNCFLLVRLWLGTPKISFLGCLEGPQGGWVGGGCGGCLTHNTVLFQEKNKSCHILAPIPAQPSTYDNFHNKI